VETARAIYASNAFEPGYSRGSELGWATMGGPNPFLIGLDFFRYVVFEDPAWDFRSFDLARDGERAVKKVGAILNAMNPDVRAFLDRGGKLIQYHGWNDPQIAPGFSVAYYKSVLEKLGDVKSGYRLFMVPGMAHCGGGEGASSFDMPAALENWVEKKEAPDQIVAARMLGQKVVRTRLLCPYPQVAVFKGTGTPDDSSNYTCKEVR
jgi:feruloyl esterase